MTETLLSDPATRSTRERRGLLETVKNPDPKLDYVSRLSGNMVIFGSDRPTGVILRYVPDRLILPPAAFRQYLDKMGSIDWPSLEAAAATILNDISNELVARWVQVSVSAPNQFHTGVESHDVRLEDRQPNWENDGLLSRLDVT